MKKRGLRFRNSQNVALIDAKHCFYAYSDIVLSQDRNIDEKVDIIFYSVVPLAVIVFNQALMKLYCFS